MGSPFATDKMFRHLDRLAEWQAGGLPPPVTVELDLTNRCNHRCPGCTFGYLTSRNVDTIPYDDAVRYIDQCASMGVNAITFSGGGEPLMYGESQILQLMRRCREWDMDCALITNGSRMESDEYASVCEWVRVSLDGYDAESFKRFHGVGGGAFEKVCDNLARLCRVQWTRRATIGAGFLTPANTSAEFFRLAVEFCSQRFPGLDYVQFRPLVASWHDDEDLRGGYPGPISRRELERLRIAFEASRRYAADGLAVLWSEDKYATLAEPDFGRTYPRCYGAFLQTCISADQRVYLCCHGQGRGDFCLGDLREKPLQRIWTSVRAAEVREQIDPRTMCPPACRLHPQNRVLAGLRGEVSHVNFI